MERYLVPVDAPRNRKRCRRPRWGRSALELDGRISSRYRHETSQLIIDSYSEVRAFGHHYSIGFDMCPTHMTLLANAVNQDEPISSLRAGISGLEFDSKGIYLASVTKSGCLTVHDFESLYCTTYGSSSSLLEDEKKQLLHHSTSQPLGVVRWNPTNQDEVSCASRQGNKVLIFDIGYVSSEPIEVLEKGKPKNSRQDCERHIGLSDIIFPSVHKSRFFSSGLDGVVYGWDRRISPLPYLELTNNSQTQLTSLQLDIEDRVVFAAGQNGIIYAWDLRGGRTSLAFQSHNEVYYPLLASFKLSSMLERIAPLKAQLNIISRGIHSINFDPSCGYQLAFHLYDGWSGVLNLNSSSVTHVHCPPSWLDDQELSSAPSDLRKPCWLPTSIYTVGSSSSNGLYLLDFFPDSSSACHVDFNEELLDNADENKRIVRNRFLPLSQSVVVCTAHPLNGTIVAGTKDSSLMLVSQKHENV
ncbi:putative transcription factor WD40-like family [Dioscorea sansibarensis]